jgi:hypothetical protein
MAKRIQVFEKKSCNRHWTLVFLKLDVCVFLGDNLLFEQEDESSCPRTEECSTGMIIPVIWKCMFVLH